jgi:hypothetical protein
MWNVLQNNLLVNIDALNNTKTIDLKKWFDEKVNSIQWYNKDQDRIDLKNQIFLQYGLDIDDPNTRADESKNHLCNEEWLL